MTHAMLKGSNVPLDATAVRAVLRWTPGQGPRRRCLGAAPRSRRSCAIRRGLRLLQPATPSLGQGVATWQETRRRGPHRHHPDGSGGCRSGVGRIFCWSHRRTASPSTRYAPYAFCCRARPPRPARRGPTVSRWPFFDIKPETGSGDRADLRRTVPARSGLEVPGARRGLSERSGGARLRLRDHGGRVRAGGGRARTRRRPRLGGPRGLPGDLGAAPASRPPRCPGGPRTAIRGPRRRPPPSPRTATPSRPASPPTDTRGPRRPRPSSRPTGFPQAVELPLPTLTSGCRRRGHSSSAAREAPRKGRGAVFDHQRSALGLVPSTATPPVQPVQLRLEAVHELPPHAAR